MSIATQTALLAALTTGHKIGLAAVGLAFIAFALASSFLFPRSNPNFPGKAMPWFIVGSVAFFVAMLAAVLVFGIEEKKAEGATATSADASGSPAPSAAGDAKAGKAVFTGTAGCGGCHTLAGAGSKGTIGPNLDQAKPERSLILTRVTLGKSPMPAFKGQLSDKQIADVVAYVYASTHS